MGYYLMRKLLFSIIFILLLLPTTVGARNLFEVGLGVSGIYDSSQSTETDSFFNGMGDGDNWALGVGLNTRLSIVNLSILAMIPAGGGTEEMAYGLRTSLSLDIPLVTDRLYLSTGAGLSTNFSSGDGEGSGPRVNNRALDSTSFEEAITSSNLHMKAGIDILFGSAKLGLFYLLESTGTVEGVMDGNWSDLFRTNGSNRFGMMVQLALY